MLTPMDRWRHIRWPALAGAAILLWIAGLGLRQEFAERRLRHRLQTWPTAQGLVTESRVHRQLDGSLPGKTVTIPEIHCEMTIGGERIETEPEVTGYENPYTLVDANPPGREVTLYYDPVHPERTIYDARIVYLENDNRWWITLMLLGAVALLVYGVRA